MYLYENIQPAAIPFRNPNLSVFTVDQGGPGRPPAVPATAQWTPSAPAVSLRPQVSPGPAAPPPYSKTVYDPNSADELRDWEDRNN